MLPVQDNLWDVLHRVQKVVVPPFVPVNGHCPVFIHAEMNQVGKGMVRRWSREDGWGGATALHHTLWSPNPRLTLKYNVGRGCKGLCIFLCGKSTTKLYYFHRGRETKQGHKKPDKNTQWYLLGDRTPEVPRPYSDRHTVRQTEGRMQKGRKGQTSDC